MGQVLVTNSLVGDTDSGFAYYGVWGGQIFVPDTYQYQYPSSVQLIIVQMHVVLYAAGGTLAGPGAGKRIQVYLRNEDSITPFDLSFEDDESDKTMRSMEPVSIQDRLNIVVRRYDDAITVFPKITLVCDVVTAKESVAFGYDSLMGYFLTDTRGNAEEFLAAHAATISDLAVRLYSAPGSGDSVTYTLEKNDVATSLAVTISNTDREGIDSVNSVAVVAGDRLEIVRTTSGSPAALAHGGVSVKVTGAVDDDYIMGGAIKYLDYLGTTTGKYSSVIGGDSSSSAWGSVSALMSAINLNHIRVHLDVAPGNGKSITVTLKKVSNGSTTSEELLTIADANTTGNADLDVDFLKGDRAYLEWSHSGDLEGDTFYIEWGLTARVTPTAPSITLDKIVNKVAYANISNVGGGTSCSVRGFCYKEATSGDPNVFDDSYEVDGDLDTDGEFAVGDYNLTLSLDAGKLYRVRAFAINDEQMEYSTTMAAYFEYPSDAVARVSSIRRVYQPGLYRMEIGVGELGFDVEVSEAAIKRVSDEVTETDENKELMEEVRAKVAEHERELRKARSKVTMEAELERGSALSRPNVFTAIDENISRVPTMPELLKDPTPLSVLAALSPIAVGRTVYEVGKNIVSNLIKGLFG